MVTFIILIKIEIENIIVVSFLFFKVTILIRIVLLLFFEIFTIVMIITIVIIIAKKNETGQNLKRECKKHIEKKTHQKIYFRKTFCSRSFCEKKKKNILNAAWTQKVHRGHPTQKTPTSLSLLLFAPPLVLDRCK